MSVRPNPEQQRVVDAPGSVAVTAGAGTGKTEMLAKRIAEHVARDGLRPLEIVAVTFTERAAAELRTRAAAHLRGRDGIAEALLDELDAAPFGTLHSLAARICREHPEAAGVSPAFGILGDEEADLWSRQRLDEILTRQPPERFGGSDGLPWSLARDAVHRLAAEPWIADQALARAARPWPVVRAEWQAIADRARALAWAELVDDEWRRCAVFVRGIHGEVGDKLENARRQVVLGLHQLETALAAGDDSRPALEAMAAAGLQGGRKDAWPACTPAEVRDRLRPLRDGAKKALGDWRIAAAVGPLDEQHHRLLVVLAGLYTACAGELGELKRSAGVLSFADLEVGALRALEDVSVQRWYAARWKAVLVDEAQDINPTQAELLARLRRLEPPPRITAVGDRKQSIYGFRHARPEEFEALGRALDETVQLALTYRQHAGLAEQINGLFAALLPDYEPVRSERRATRTGPYIELAVVSGEGGSVDDRRRVEAAYLATRVAAWRDRDVPLHQIAVLSRAWEPLDLYADALAAAGLDVAHLGGGSLLATREAQDGWALLRAVASPDDDLALAAVLRSPFVAADDASLLALAETADGRPWSACLAELPQLLPAAAIYADLLDAAGYEPPSRLLARADDLCGYTAVLHHLPLPQRRLADWRGFVDWVRGAESGHDDAFWVVRQLRQVAEANVRLPRPTIEAGDGVVLSSIHSAKGLEWDIVVVPDLARRPGGDRARLMLDRVDGVSLRLPLGKGATQPLLTAEMLDGAHRRERAEMARLAYVAVTRAREQVLLTSAGAAKEEGEGSSMLELLHGPLVDIGIEPAAIAYEPALALPPLSPPPAPPPEPHIVLLEPLSPSLTDVPASALDRFAECPLRFWYEVGEEHPGVPQGEAGGEARRLGILVHRALEVDLRDEADLRREDPSLADATYAQALRMLANWDMDPVFQPVRGEARREVELVGEVRDIRIHARMDRLADDFVLDFKTGTAQEEGRFDLQLWAYAAVSGRARAYVADLRTPALHTVSPGAAARGEAVLGRIAAGDFAADPEPTRCGGCPYALFCAASAAAR